MSAIGTEETIDRVGRINGLQRNAFYKMSANRRDEREDYGKKVFSIQAGTAISVVIALTSVEQFQSSGDHFLHRLARFTKELVGDEVVRLSRKRGLQSSAPG